MKSVLGQNFEYKTRLFRSKQEYIDEFSGIHNLDFEYFEDLFRLFLVTNLIIFIVFIFNCIFEKIKIDCHIFQNFFSLRANNDDRSKCNPFFYENRNFRYNKN